MGRTLAEIAEATGLTLVGDGALTIERLAAPERAGPADLAVALDRKYGDALAAAPCRAAVIWEGADLAAFGLAGALIGIRPRAALAHLTSAFQAGPEVPEGVHPSAVVDPTADIGPGAAIGPLAVVGPGARIGARVQIHAHVTIGAGAEIGADCLLHPGVRVGAGCRLGTQVIVHANAVIGSDGFSFEPPERGAVDAAKETGTTDGAAKTVRFLRIHSLAGVEIGDDVEIGAGTAIDRGTLAATQIGRGTKIDNLVQIGHNARIGETCLICGLTGIAGSVRIGDRVVLGGKCGVGDHLQIGSDSVFAAGSLVATNVPAGSVMMGVPAQPRAQTAAQVMALKRLPRMLDDLAKIRKKLGL